MKRARHRQRHWNGVLSPSSCTDTDGRGHPRGGAATVGKGETMLPGGGEGRRRRGGGYPMIEGRRWRLLQHNEVSKYWTVSGRWLARVELVYCRMQVVSLCISCGFPPLVSLEEQSVASLVTMILDRSRFAPVCCCFLEGVNSCRCWFCSCCCCC